MNELQEGVVVINVHEFYVNSVRNRFIHLPTAADVR